MLASYMSMLMIPILIGSSIYMMTTKVIHKQAEEMNMAFLKMVQIELDQQIDEMQSIADLLVMNTDIQKLTKVKNQFDLNQFVETIDLVSELQSMPVFDNIDDIFIYFNNTQRVSSTSGNANGDFFYDLFFKSDVYSFAEFQEYMKQPHYHDVMIYEKSNGERMLLLTMTTLSTSLGEPSATIGITMNSKTIEHSLATMNTNEDLQVLLINDENQMITQSGKGTESLSQLTYENLQDGIVTMLDIGQEEQMTLTTSSSWLNWKYVAIMQISTLYAEVKSIQAVSSLAFLFCVMVGFFLCRYLTKKNYDPWKELANKLWEEGDNKNSSWMDEYDFVNEKLTDVFEAQIQAKKMLVTNKKTIKDHYLYELLLGYQTKNQILFEDYDIQIAPYHLTIVLLPQRSTSEQEQEEYIKENALQKFILQNILSEMVSLHYNIELVEVGERVVAIVGLDDDDQEHMIKLIGMLEELLQMIQKTFKFTSFVLFGDIVEGVEGIHESYFHAMDSDEYLHLLDTDVVIYDYIKNIKPKYEYSMEMEKKILNALKIADADMAIEYVMQVIDSNCKDSIHSSFYRCMIFDLASTLIRGSSLAGYLNATQELTFPNKEFARKPVNYVKQEFSNLIRNICKKIETLEEDSEQDQTLSKAIEAYIGEHFSDPDLNISIASQHFSLTPAYLSRMYKKQTRKSLLEQINEMRLTAAEQLLEQG